MRLGWLRPRTIAGILAAGVLLLLYEACSFDFTRQPEEEVGQLQGCEAEVWHCPATTPLPLLLELRAAPGHPQVLEYKITPDLGGTLGESYRPYHNKEVLFQDIGKDSLMGASVIETGGPDWKVADEAFMDVILTTDAEAVYLAFDSRAAPPPWLEARFTKQLEVVTLSRRDQAATTPRFLTMDLWRLDGERRAGERIPLPGASYQGTGWAPKAAGQPLMYTVLVEPVTEADCTASRTYVRSFERKGCFEPSADETAAGTLLTDTLLACEAEPENAPFTCLNPVCEPEPACLLTDGIGGQKQGIRSYNVGSTVEFIAPSGIDAAIAGESGSADVTGTLKFSYGDDLTQLTIDDLALAAGTVSIEGEAFEDTTLVLWAPATASCVGDSSAFAQPCTNYRIETGGLAATVTTRFDGQDLLWLGESDQPIDITIDHDPQTFHFVGRLNVSIIVDDDPEDLSVQLDLYGHITDVAPNAVGYQEYPPTAECVEDLNGQPIELDAQGSFDVYSASPTNLPRYEWYEDYGLITEHLWKKEKKVVIPQGTLAYGTHQMTLVVADQTGLVDTHTFDVEVIDTEPPVFTTLPQDITTDVLPAGTESVLVDLGTVQADVDACAGQVTVSHDGPEDGMFAPGVHTVTWTADDERGNIVTVPQRVDVPVLSEGFAWWWIAGPAAGAIALAGGALLVARRRRSTRAAEEAARMEAGVPGPPGVPPPPPSPPAVAWPGLVGIGVAAAVVVGLGAWVVVQVTADDDQEAAATTVVSTTIEPVSTTIVPPTTTTTIVPPTTTTTIVPPTTTTTIVPPTTTTTIVPPTTTTTIAPPTTTTTIVPPTTTTTTTTVPGPLLDPNAPPRYGSHKLVSGFLEDPATYEVYAGGPVDLHAMPQIGCTGWAASNPDLRLDWAGDTLLRFYFIPDDPAADTVLVINDPSGTWHCVDDSYGTPHPTLDFDPSQRGFYEIWVATYSEIPAPPGTLLITEFGGNHP